MSQKLASGYQEDIFKSVKGLVLLLFLLCRFNCRLHSAGVQRHRRAMLRTPEGRSPDEATWISPGRRHRVRGWGGMSSGWGNWCSIHLAVILGSILAPVDLSPSGFDSLK
ncbi:hypothetical protein L484_015627 [Morus notabilis]|uniref:Uncharacterized protein n=1 Tax=Morus notabilis TaxID=981085 RepID=W9R686_9ROSA|nr:hypothetical protein L484_015627 [Morus notabilis]